MWLVLIGIKSEYISSLTSSQNLEQVNMKSKQLNSNKYFISTPYPPLLIFSINWGDKTNIDMAVDILTNALVANMLLSCVQTGGNNVLTSHIQIGGSNMSMSCSQDMDTSTTIPNIESMATLYGNNQPADPNL